MEAGKMKEGHDHRSIEQCGGMSNGGLKLSK